MRTFLKTSVQVFFGLFFLFLVVSCSDSPTDIITKKNSELNNTLDNLNAIAAKISDQTFDSDKILLPADSSTIDMNDIGSYAYEGNSNAQLFTVQDLLDPDSQSNSMHLFPSRMTWQSVKAMVKDGKFPKSKEESLQTLKRFFNWRYVVVIKTRSVQAPQIESQPVSTNVTDNSFRASGTFTGGRIEGDVLIYDLNDNRFIGGFPFTAQSSENVESTTYGGGGGNEDLQQQLDRDFTEQIKKAVFYGLVDRLPKDRVYMNGNLRQRVMTEKGEKSD